MKAITRYITRVSAILTMVIAAIILLNWFFFTPDNILPKPGNVKFNTGVCLLLTAVSLYFLDQKNAPKTGRAIIIACSAIVLLFALLTLAEYIFKTDLGIDQFLWKEKNPLPDSVFPGRMTILGSSIFVLLSITHILANKRKYHLLVQVILIILFAILSLFFLGYITQIDNESVSVTRPTALYTSFTLLILCIGTFFSYPLYYLKFSFQKRMVAFFSSMILLLVIVYFSFQTSGKRFTDTAKWLEHTNVAILQTQQVLNHVQDMEIGLAAFVISGEENSLEPFNKAVATIPRAIEKLKETTKDNPQQQFRIESLNKIINRNIESNRQLVEIRRKNGVEAAEKFFEADTTKKKVSELLEVIATIENQESQLLTKRKNDNEQSITASKRIIILFQFVVLFLLLIVFIVIYKNVRSRNKVEREIRLLNETLEHKVEEKTNELLKSELHFRNILDNLLEGAQIISFDWKYLYVNDSFLKHAKYTREELIGYTVMEKYPGIEQAEIFKVYQHCFNDRVPIHLENEFEFPNGSLGWFELSFQPVPEGIFILSVDITERKKAQEAMLRLNETLDKRAVELQSSNSELERFAYVASHDLQEPLRMVSSFLHLLERKMEGKLDDTTRQYIDFAVDGAERMKSLIQDLLQYSRVGTSKENIKDVDCNEVMDSVRSVLSLSIHENKATIHARPLPVIKAVHPQMLQLFQNLIGNAIKYHSKAPPVIEVGCTEKTDTWEFYVKDNGIGIDAKFFDKIFIIFQRLHSKTEYSGTGIGLSICKKIVEKHGGKIWVTSEPSKGSSFYFTIPKNLE